MKTAYWLSLLLLLYGPARIGLCLSEPPQRQLSAAQQQADFRLFRAALQELHPGAYRYTSPTRFDALFDSTFALLNQPRSEQAYYALLIPLVVRLRCGHTKFLPANRDDKFPYQTSQLFPLRLHLHEGRAYVLYAYDGSRSVPAGAELLSINGQPVAAILPSLLPYVSFADGATTTAKWQELSTFFAGYYAAFGPAATDHYTVRYQQPDGHPTEAVLPAATLAAVKTEEARRAPAPRYPLRLEFLPNAAAVLTIDHFWVGDQQQPYADFLRDAFGQLRARGTKSLVIDVRDNEGGNDYYGTLLYSYLAVRPFRYYQRLGAQSRRRVSVQPQVHSEWFYGLYRRLLISRSAAGGYEFRHRKGLKPQQPQPNAFGGDVYVLINGWSFSTTAEFTAVAREQGRATFIGQETGGAAGGNNSGFFTFVSLPHSGFTLGLPTWSYYMAVPSITHPERGIQPDYPVAPTAADVLRGHDPARQLALDLIRRKAEPSTPE